MNIKQFREGTYSRIKLVIDNWCISALVSSQSKVSCNWGLKSCRGKGCIVHKLEIITKGKNNPLKFNNSAEKI